jgi:hypothetical protein
MKTDAAELMRRTMLREILPLVNNIRKEVNS